MTIEAAYLINCDGTLHPYTPRPGWIPTGTLAFPLDVWDEILPGTNGAAFSGACEVRQVGPKTWRSDSTVTLIRYEKGNDGVWRKAEASEPLRRITVETY